MPTELDWARLATWIDSEGTIGIYPENGRWGNPIYHAYARVVNKDRKVVGWCARFGGSVKQDKRGIWS